MRITNKIMQNNSLYNLNNNKVLQDKLNTQMSTHKKITKPSDDPVIAIRALRLRSTLSQVTQFHDKNIEDAESWLEVTEGAIDSITDIVDDLIDKARDGADGKKETSDRQKIIEQMKALRDEIYATGDADYAGRSLFTGYRTGTKLRFQEATTAIYDITEKMTKESIDSIMFVDTGKLGTVNGTNYDQVDVDEQDITYGNIDRFRLAYKGLNGQAAPGITYTDNAGQQQTVNWITQYTDENGQPADITTAEEAYREMARINANPPVAPVAIFVPETGEVLLSDALSKELQSLPKTAEISVVYQKTEWARNDLRPEHYFRCIDYTNNITYDTPSSDQEIEYDVGFNQRLRINSTAGDVYTHDIGRDVDELVKLSQQVIDMETLAEKLEGIIEKETDPVKKAAAQKRLDATNKALTFLRGENLQYTFEKRITSMQGYQNQTTLALTACGTRGARLDLVRTRLLAQKTSFEELVSDNENVDIAKVAIEFESAKTSYDAALMATGKVVQNSLLDFL